MYTAILVYEKDPWQFASLPVFAYLINKCISGSLNGFIFFGINWIFDNVLKPEKNYLDAGFK